MQLSQTQRRSVVSMVATLFVSAVVGLPTTIAQAPSPRPTAGANSDSRSKAKLIQVAEQRYREAGINSRGYREFVRERDGATVVLIPGGQFHQRGYWDVPGTEMKDERNWVYAPAMLYDKCEVTNGQVARFLQQAKGLTFSDGQVSHGDQPWAVDHPWGLTITEAGAKVQPGYERHPAVGTSGWLALAYSKWVGGTLPNGVQFEKAASGPSGLLFPWGNEDKLPDSTRANNYLHGPKRTMPVGSYPDGASPWGLLDMSGNVYERAFWGGIASQDPNMRTQLPTMLKGGAWVSPNWSNMRCVDRCGQGMDLMEGSVGFRACVTDPTILEHFVAEKTKLRVSTDTLDAYFEASERNVPIFLYMGYERCGQCDRVQSQLFRDPRFIEYCNEHLVVLIGHNRRETNDMPKTPLTDNGTYFVHIGASITDIEQVWWDFSMWRVSNYVPLPDSVPLFQISPGLFVLNPHREEVRNPSDAVLVDDQTFMGHKGGGELDFYLDQFRRAQSKLGRGLTLREYEAEVEPPETTWRPTAEDAALWQEAKKRMEDLRETLVKFARENDGRYPEDLEALRPTRPRGWLPSDPFRGGYFRYESRGTSFQLTCFGRGDEPGGDEIPDRDIKLTEAAAQASQSF